MPQPKYWPTVTALHVVGAPVDTWVGDCTGDAVLLLPTPGGTAPEWLQWAVRFKAPLVPLPIWVALLAAVLGHALITRSAFGTLARGLGGNAAAVGRAGWSLVRIRCGVYAVAGLFGVCAGLMLVGQTTSADAKPAEDAAKK